jgi:predicted signal transduction protein with EAL and GGDEF domain
MYADDQDEYSLDRLALAAQLRRGLELGELVVHYQLKRPVRGDAVCGAEALARWNHPQLGQIGPDGFIPLASCRPSWNSFRASSTRGRDAASPPAGRAARSTRCGTAP